jgi:hypothetical protein
MLSIKLKPLPNAGTARPSSAPAPRYLSSSATASALRQDAHVDAREQRVRDSAACTFADRAAGVPGPQSGEKRPLCAAEDEADLALARPRKRVRFQGDSLQQSTCPPSGRWTGSFTSAMLGGPHDEEQEYHFHADGRMTGHVTNKFGEHPLKGTWSSDGSFTTIFKYRQIGGDLAAVEGKICGKMAQANVKTYKDRGLLSSRFDRAMAEKRQPNALAKGPIKGILKKRRVPQHLCCREVW